MRVYILGITGLLGSELFLRFIKEGQHLVKGSTRKHQLKEFPILNQYKKNIDFGIDIINLKNLKKKIKEFNPDYVINCIGYVKQKINKFTKKSEVMYVNAVFPKKIYLIVKKLNSRLIHFSSDCVFDGKIGNYCEKEKPNASDLYGFSKYLGELNDKKAITIRTSIIGHEIKEKFGLLEWFLSKKKCYGFTNSYFSGLTSFEIYNFINNYLFKKKNINGLFNLSSSKISKYELLKIIKSAYKKKIFIKKDGKFKINRTLNSQFIKKKLSYKNPSWPKMIKKMYLNKKAN